MKKLTTLQPSEKLILCAEACGWQQIEKIGMDREWHGWREKGPLVPLPDYANDLNAMHEVEKSIKDTDCWRLYKEELSLMPIDPIHATAAQRLDAFLIAKGLAV